MGKDRGADQLAQGAADIVTPLWPMASFSGYGIVSSIKILASMKMGGTSLFSVYSLFSYIYIPFTYLLLTSFNRLHRLFNEIVSFILIFKVFGSH